MALTSLAKRLADVEGAAARLAIAVPWIGWDRETTIVAIFTEFTIALIPLIWIYVFAVRGARWVILAFGVLKLVFAIRPFLAAIRFDAIEPLSLIEPALLILALAMLFTPSAGRWLRLRKEIDPATFD